MINYLISAAVAGSDYVPVTKEIIFNSYSQNPHRVYIPIINDDDDCVEENEYFSVKINTDMECVDLPVDLVNITILDNDSQFYSSFYTNVCR